MKNVNSSAPNTKIKNQTPAQKEREENLTEKDLNPSKEEKQILKEHGGKGEQQPNEHTKAAKDKRSFSEEAKAQKPQQKIGFKTKK